MIGIKSTGSFANFESFFRRTQRSILFSDLDSAGRAGVDALASATPENTGETANSWEYRIVNKGETLGIEWYNTHEHNGANIAILIQYGHATGTGGYVTGQDYINPAIKPIFDKISEDIWKKVTRA